MCVFVPVVEVGAADDGDEYAGADEDGGNADTLVVAVAVVLHGHCRVGKFEHRLVLAVLELFVICVMGTLLLLALPPHPFVGVIVREAGRLLVRKAAFKEDTTDDADVDEVVAGDEVVPTAAFGVVSIVVCGDILLLLLTFWVFCCWW